MSVGTGLARRGSRCVYACSLSPTGKRRALAVIFVIHSALFFFSRVPSPGGERESGRNFFFFLQSVSKFLKVEFPADYAEVKHGGS